MQVLHVCLISKTGVSGEHRAGGINILADTKALVALSDKLCNRLKGMVFLAFTKSLRLDNHLMPLVHGGHPIIALDRALAGGHLGAFVISNITLHFPEAATFAHPWRRCL